MKKLKFLSITLGILLLFAGLAAADGQWSPLFIKQSPGGIFGVLDTSQTTGDIWYVDSGMTVTGGDTAGHGRNPISPCLTLDYCAAMATANNGDIVYVAAGHAETISAADGFDITIAGLRIVGLGEGGDRPAFTFDETASTVAIGAANVTIENFQFIAGVHAIVLGIAVEDAGDNFTLLNSVFPEPSDGTYDFIDGIDLEDDANGVRIIGNEYYHTAAVGPEHFIEAGNGANDGLQIINNDIQGEFSVAAIWSNDADLRCKILNNRVVQMTSGEFAIEFAGNATGFADGNRVFTNAEATSATFGTMYLGENLTTTTTAKSGAPYPVHDTGWTQLNATTLTAVQTSMTAAIDADELDTLLKVASGTGASPTSVVQDSVIAHMISKDDPPVNTSYVNTTDALEALSDKLGAFTADEGTDQDDSVFSDLDLIQTDLDTLTAAMGPYYLATVTTGGTTTFIDTAMIGYGTNYFKTNWMACVIWDAGGGNVAPEGECQDITGYVTGTGQFTVAVAFTTTGTDDVIMIKRREDMAIDSALLDTTPLAGSLATFVAGGAAGQGTQLYGSKSLVDIIGTDGNTIQDTNDSIAGMLGVDDSDNTMATTSVVANDDGSVFERLEFIQGIGGDKIIVPVTAAVIDTTHTTALALGQYPTGYFAGDWSMVVLFDQAAGKAAPEGEIVDVTANVTATGALTHAALASAGAATGDIIMLVRTADLGSAMMITTSVLADADGSNVERLEYLAQMSEQVLAGMRASGRSIGNVYYVDDAGGNTSYSGLTWALAKALIVQGYDLTADDKGDIVFVAPDHEETLAAATTTLDEAGVTIVGLGTGEKMPMITMTAGASKINVTAADVTIEGIHFYSTTTDNVVTIDADASGLVVRGCQFTGTAAGHVLGIDLATTLKDIVIEDNFVYDLDTDGDAFINATAGAQTNLVIQNNRIWGDYDDAGIHSDAANLNTVIKGNTVNNVNAGQHAVQLSGASTGYIHNNILSATVPGAILDPGSCMAFDNKIVESDMTDAPDHAMMEDGWYYSYKLYDLLGTAGTTALFTVTGTVEVLAYGEVTETLTSDAGTVALGGIDGNTVLLIAATGGNAPLSIGDVWTSATSASSASSPSKVIMADDDIGITESGENLNDGAIGIHCYWRPLEESASVVAN